MTLHSADAERAAESAAESGEQRRGRSRADLPLRAEDAVAKLKRSREQTTSPDAGGGAKRQRTVEAAGGGSDARERSASSPEGSERRAPSGDESDEKRRKRGSDGGAVGGAGPLVTNKVLDDVAAFPRRVVGSVVYAPRRLIARGHELQYNGVLQVKIGHEFLADAEGVRARAVWGTEVYTDDTDLIAALAHLGLLAGRPRGQDLLVDVLLLPPLQKYTGSLRHGLNSRSWLTRHDGISYMVLGVRAMPAGWAHAGKGLLYMRYEVLRDLRSWSARSVAYADA